MKILKMLLYLVLGLAALVVLLGLFAKKDYHVERSAEIAAPKSLVLEQVSNFKNFASWSPWQELDPNMKVSMSENQGKVGATYSWEGNDKVGKGMMTLKTLTDSRADIKLDFDGFGTSPSYFDLSEADGKTKITWGMDMHIPFPWNAFTMFTDMDAAGGKDYEKGLSNLKTRCEGMAKKKYEVKEADIEERTYVGFRKTVAFADMVNFFGENFGKAATEYKMTGPLCGLFWNYDEAAGNSDCAAVATVAKGTKPGAGAQVFTVGGKKALVIDYYGPYEKTGEAHLAMDEYMAAKGLSNIPPVIEEYITDTEVEKDTAKWLTRVVYFVEPKK